MNYKSNQFRRGLPRRLSAMILAVCMVFTMSPSITEAEASYKDHGEPVMLSGFVELPENIRRQSVPLGTALDEMNLPDTLEATEQTDGAPPTQSDELVSKSEIIPESNVPLTASPSDAEDATASDAEEDKNVTISGVTWESDPLYDAHTSGTYRFTAVLPSGYTVEDGVAMPEITVTVEKSAVDKVIAMIDALPAMEEWLAMDEIAAREVMDEILAAKKAYDGLNNEEKALIDETRTAKLTELAEMAEQLVGIMPMAASNPVTIRANAADTAKLDVSANGDTTTVDPVAEDITITGTYTSIEIDVNAYTGAVVPNVILSGATILPLTPPTQTGTSGKVGTAGAPAVTINGVVNLIVNAGSTVTGGQGGQGGQGRQGVPGMAGTADSPNGKPGGQGGTGGIGGTGGAGISVTGTCYITDLGTVAGGVGGEGGSGGRPGLSGPQYKLSGRVARGAGDMGETGAIGVAGQAIVGTYVAPPTISKVTAADLTDVSATLSGTITAGGENVTETGFFYKAASDSTWTSAAVAGTDNITLNATGLTKDVEYIVRAYAVVNGNKLLGESANFTPVESFPMLDFATTGSTTPHTGTGYAWEESTKTLTLTDFNYTATDAVGIALPDGATLVLNGTSALTATAVDEISCALRCDGSLTVSGTGSLSATASDTSGMVSGGIVVVALTVESGSITGIGGAGAQVSSGVFVGENLTLKGGSITGVGGTNATQMSNGVAVQTGSINVTGGTLTATSGTGGMSAAVVASSLNLGDKVVAKCNIGSNTGYADEVNLAMDTGLSMGVVYEGIDQTTIATDVKIYKPDIASGESNTCSWRIDEAGLLTIWPTKNGSGTLDSYSNSTQIPWKNNLADVKKVQVKSGVNTDYYAIGLFSGLVNCTEIDLTGLNTTKAEKLTELFHGCTSLTSLTFGSSFKTEAVIDMSGMFSNCKELTILDISGFDTKNVKNAGNMFNGMESLISVTLGDSFSNGTVTTLGSMFAGCSNLASLDLSKFNTSNVTNIKAMFQNCSKLTSLDLSSFTNPNATSMLKLFEGCTDLETIVFGNDFSTASVKSMNSMFKNCSALKSLDVSSLATGKVTDMLGMFEGCSELTAIDLSTFDTSAVTDMDYMFSGCTALSALDLSNFSTAKLQYTSSMFNDCTLGLNTKFFKTNMNGTKIYLYDKDSKDDLANTDLRGDEENIVYRPYAITKTETTNGSFTVSSDVEAENYFTKTESFYTDAPAYDKTKSYAQLGKKVTITPTPAFGYVLDTLSVTNGGTTITTTPSGSSYTFIMPADEVTVTTSFKPGEYKVTITVNKDNAQWSDSGKGFKLSKDEGASFITDLTKVLNGTYTIYEMDGTSTGVSVTINNAEASAAVDYYTVTFYDGATAYSTPAPQVVLKTNGRVTAPADPAKTGYTFAGWKTTNDGTTAFNFTNEAITAASGVYASWTANTYTVTLNGDGGTGTALTSYTYAEGAALPSDWTKQSYIFAGWYSDSSFSGSPVTAITATDIEDKEFWAKWTPVSVTGVSLDKTGITLVTGENETLTATVLPDDAFNKNVTWTSDNTGVATVANGVVTAVNVGTATITVTTADGSKTASCIVTVNPNDAQIVAAAKEAAETSTYAATTQAATDTEEAAKAYVENIATTAVNNSSVTVTVDQVSYIAPVAGTRSNREGTNGSYTFTVTVSKGTQSQTTIQLTIIITATAYSGSSSDDDDGTTTSSASKPVEPVTGSTENKAAVDDKGNANVTITNKNIADTIANAMTEANKKGVNPGEITAVINVTTEGKDAAAVSVNLPKVVQDQIIGNKIAKVEFVIDRPDLTIGMNLAAVTEINRQANGDVRVSAGKTNAAALSAEAKTAIGNRPAYDLRATCQNGGKSVQNFGKGAVSIEIPYKLQSGETAGNIYAVHVDGNGKVTYLPNSGYDVNRETLVFSTNHFSVYGVGFQANTPKFTDITNHWAKDEIEFAVSRGLISGTGNTSFSPDSAMTRGMFVTALGRLAGVDVSSYKTSSFGDVKADSYYKGYIEWSSKNNILAGIGGGNFAPDSPVTREQMAVAIERYATVTGFKLPEAQEAHTFADHGKISTWAWDAIKRVRMAGIITGKTGNRFDPQGAATRAEVSAVLKRFVELTAFSDTAQGWKRNDSGKWMYYENGKAVTGQKTIGGIVYQFDSYGEMVYTPKQ